MLCYWQHILYRILKFLLCTFFFYFDLYVQQGKAIQQTLNGMSFSNVSEVRQGKYFEIDVKENDDNKAKKQVDDMCKKLLANLVIENYKIIDPK